MKTKTIFSYDKTPFQFYTKTMDLRFNNGILEQRHQGSLGDVIWEKVESINI